MGLSFNGRKVDSQSINVGSTPASLTKKNNKLIFYKKYCIIFIENKKKKLNMALSSNRNRTGALHASNLSSSLSSVTIPKKGMRKGLVWD